MSKRIRKPAFGRRSSLPASAACVVANGVRETLSSILGTQVEMRLFEPSIPTPPAWPAILKDAVLYRVRGSIADAAIVLRSVDALALAAALFGEQCSLDGDRALSPIERDVVDRTANAIAAHLGCVCGTRESRGVERVETIEGYSSYFELLLEEPVTVRIGIALSREPSPEPRARVEIGHLSAVSVPARATLDLGRVLGGAVARLSPGTILPLRSSDLQSCRLSTYGRNLARGTCGVRHGRYAFTVDVVADAT